MTEDAETSRPVTAAEDESDRATLLTALVTEHFVLQSAAGATVSESGSRASIYLAALSSGLVAIGFSSQSPSTLLILASTVLPTAYILGWFTIVRLTDTSISAAVAQQRIEAIRSYYASLSRRAAEYFPADGGRAGTLGVRYRARSLLFTTSSMISVVNSVVGGAATALILAIGAQLGTFEALALGGLVGVISLVGAFFYQVRRFRVVRHPSRRGEETRP